jgi:hypothetical protein
MVEVKGTILMKIGLKCVPRKAKSVSTEVDQDFLANERPNRS